MSVNDLMCRPQHTHTHAKGLGCFKAPYIFPLLRERLKVILFSMRAMQSSCLY